jgi:hypothetical protein
VEDIVSDSIRFGGKIKPVGLECRFPAANPYDRGDASSHRRRRADRNWCDVMNALHFTPPFLAAAERLMNVTCAKCSKVLKVKDEFAGRMLKCPGCGTTFRADPSGKAAPIAGAPAKAAPGKSPVPAPQVRAQAAKGGGIAINWGKLVMLGLLALIPIAIVLFILGPMRVKKQWEAQQEKVENDVTDVVEFAMKAHASSEGGWDPTKATGGSPTVGEVRLLPSIFSMSLPATVKFDGYGSVGRFEGEYTLATGEIDMVLKTGGTMLPSGLYSDEEGTIMPGGQREDRPAGMPGQAGKLTPHTVKGRIVNGQPEVTIDGKKAQIIYPKRDDEDE